MDLRMQQLRCFLMWTIIQVSTRIRITKMYSNTTPVTNLLKKRKSLDMVAVIFIQCITLLKKFSGMRMQI